MNQTRNCLCRKKAHIKEGKKNIKGKQKKKQVSE